MPLISLLALSALATGFQQTPPATAPPATAPGASPQVTGVAQTPPPPPSNAELASVTLPTGMNSEMLSLIYDLRAALAEGRALEATKLGAMLPKASPRIVWNDTKLAPEQKEDFAKARDFALATWSGVVPEFEPKLVPAGTKPDVLISFVDKLPNDAGATFFYSKDPSDPRIEAVIALKRGEDYSSGIDVANELAYTLSMYFGTQPEPFFGPAASRTDHASGQMTQFSVQEGDRVRKAIELSGVLRKAIVAKEKVSAGTPDLWVAAKSVESGEVRQGEPVRVQLQVANRGTAPLRLFARGDCGCLGAVAPVEIKPSETGLIQIGYDTTAIEGDITHNVLLYSNDAEAPLQKIPVHVKVHGRYRLLRPGGFTTSMEKGEPFEFFFVTDPKSPVTVSEVLIGGVEGETTFEPWQGELDDPGMKEGVRPREGYKIRFVPTQTPPSKAIGTIAIRTDAKGLELIRSNFTVQNGIAASPPALYLGELESTPVNGKIVLSQVGKGFKILKLSLDKPGLTAKIVKVNERSDEYVIQVTADPKLVKGALEATLKVETDSKSQPVLSIPVQANLG